MKTVKLLSIAILAILFAFTTPLQEAGKINDEFKDGTTCQWKVATKEAKSVVTENKLVVTPALQADGTFRGDIASVSEVTLNANKYPIIAIKISKKQKSDFTLDTNLGTYKGSSKRIAQADGYDIYYWNITAKQFQRASDPAFDFPKEPTTLKKITFKNAAIAYTAEEVKNNKISYSVVWIKTFVSEAELKESLK